MPMEGTDALRVGKNFGLRNVEADGAGEAEGLHTYIYIYIYIYIYNRHT